MKAGEEHIIRMSFREVKKFLPENLFFQIRRNIIVNIIYITALNDTTVCLGDDHFLISPIINGNTYYDLKVAIDALR